MNDLDRKFDISESQMVDMFALEAKTLEELLQIAEREGAEVYACSANKSSVVNALILRALKEGKRVIGGGVIDVLNSSVAYARSREVNYLSGPNDIFIPNKFLSQYGIKSGHLIEGEVIVGEDRRKLRMQSITKIQGCSIGHRKRVIDFDALIPDFPTRKIDLEVESEKGDGGMGCRVLDLLVPLGFGQRALIVAPPKSGKTMLMQSIARAIEANHPKVELMVLLVDERPEEVTDMKRQVKGEVVSSNFDEPPENHVRVVDIILNKAKRIAEEGRDTVILLDSLTRLVRAHNVLIPNSGRVLSGGMDINAMQKPKKFFGAARNLQGAGSITIIATVLVDTGSKMDQVIMEELKGTGNSEVVLDRGFAELGLFPAIDISSSSTRRDSLIGGFQKKLATMIRASLASKKPEEALEVLVKKLASTKTNKQLLEKLGMVSGS